MSSNSQPSNFPSGFGFISPTITSNFDQTKIGNNGCFIPKGTSCWFGQTCSGGNAPPGSIFVGPLRSACEESICTGNDPNSEKITCSSISISSFLILVLPTQVRWQEPCTNANDVNKCPNPLNMNVSSTYTTSDFTQPGQIDEYVKLYGKDDNWKDSIMPSFCSLSASSCTNDPSTNSPYVPCTNLNETGDGGNLCQDWLMAVGSSGGESDGGNGENGDMSSLSSSSPQNNSTRNIIIIGAIVLAVIFILIIAVGSRSKSNKNKNNK